MRAAVRKGLQLAKKPMVTRPVTPGETLPLFSRKIHTRIFTNNIVRKMHESLHSLFKNSASLYVCGWRQTEPCRLVSHEPLDA
jgi:hypothetical protein